MYFKSTEIDNFRNYRHQTLEFDRHLNLFLGANAQGKTNLLEALFIMGLGKSFRTNNDKEMIRFGCEYSRVRSVVENEINGRETEIEVTFTNDGKILKVDGMNLSRTADLLENVYIVVFSPEDLKIVKEGPDNRRRFLDRELCQIKPVYYSDLGNYKKVLRQRNMLLRMQNRDMQLFSVFDESLADYGLRITEERERFLKKLQGISEKIHSDISGNTEKIDISYESRIKAGGDFEERKEIYKERLSEDFEKDMQRGYTGFGPHKDDLKIEVNGTDIRFYGSQGQQRTAALSMKLAEISLIKNETGCDAVLLLDDVLSELDSARQRYLIESMNDVQVFITATGIDESILEKLSHGRRYRVTDGDVKLLT